MRFRQIVRAVGPLALVLFGVSVVVACPTCTDGLGQNDPQGRSIAAGFYYSILFMMAMPFAILATFGGMAYLSIRRAQQNGTIAPAAERATGCGAPIDVESEPDTART